MSEVAARLLEEFYDCTAEKDWPAWGTEAVAILEKMTAKPEQHTYNCTDADLQELLNHVAYLQFTADTGGFLNHDDGMGFLMALEKVQGRLMTRPPEGKRERMAFYEEAMRDPKNHGALALELAYLRSVATKGIPDDE